MANCYQDSEADAQTIGDSPMDSRRTPPNVVNEREKVRQMKRSKRASGVRSKPVVPARPVKKGPRPSPLPRKRRASGKMMTVVHRPYISEGDMAQADEMGDVDGHDEGFQDGQEGDNKLRKKTKKKPSSAYPDAYSTSPTPMLQCSGRRRSGFRKSVTWRQSRPKPRPRVLKQKLIPGDISTQETTTTPGPNSSDSHFSGEDVDEEVMDVSVKPSSFVGFSTGNDSNEMLCDSDVLHVHPQDQVYTNKEAPLVCTNMDSNSSINIMVDGLYYNGINCSRLGSDLSTAAQSSETSEHEQSGSERQLLYLVARGNLEPLHAMMGNTNSNNGNSSKKTNQSTTTQNTAVPIPKPRTGRPASSIVNGVQPDKEKTEKPKIPPKPAIKPPVKRISSSCDQSSTAVALKRLSSPGTHTSKRYSIMPLLPTQEVTTNNNSQSSSSVNNAAPPTKVASASAVKKIMRHYEMCEPPVLSAQSKPTKQRTLLKQASPRLLSKNLSQEELKEMYSFVDTEKLRAQRNTPPPVVKPYKSSAGSSGMEDTVLSDSDSGKKPKTDSKPQKPKPTNALPPKPIKSLMPKPTPAKRQSLERSHSLESLQCPHFERTSRELGKSRSFGPADMVKISQPKGKFSFLKTKALSFGRKKASNENSPKSSMKSEPSPTNTVQILKKPLNSTDSCDRPHSPQLSPAMALKQSSLDRADTTRFKRQAAIRSPNSPRKSPVPWDSPSSTPKAPRPVETKPPEPQYETAEGFFHQVSRILRKMKNSNRTESANSAQRRNSNYQEEHIYETAEGIQARIPLSPATWMKKKLQRSASQATKKSLYAKTVERSIRRTPSMDCLDDRMLRTTLEASSSDEDMDLDGSFLSWGSSLNVSMASNLALPKPTEETAVEVEEPLYQHIRTAEFGCSPPSSSLSDNTPLEIARRGSSKICKLWSQQSRVVNSGILGTISREEQKLQEAMFEVIATEGSYVRSLDILIKHFMEDPGMNPDLPEGRRVLNRRQYHVIFSNVREVYEVAKRFLQQLEQRENEGALIRNICDIILDYTTNHFSCYVSYCTNQVYQTRQLLECMDESILFREYVKRLENHDCCQKLQLQSFLLLPMQRITRMPLLILNILNRIPLQHRDRKIVEDALRVIQSVVTECNDSARAMERTEQLHTIYNQLSFGKMKPFPLVSTSRHLVRSGMLHRLVVESRLFGRPKITCKPLFVFMFTDYIIITKPKQGGVNNKEVYRVIDHASRKFVHVVPIEYHNNFSYPKDQLQENTDYINMATWAVSTARMKYAFLVSILENVNGSTEHYVFTVNTDSERTRWVEAINPPLSDKGGETIYEAWDCPQVQAAFDYDAQQPDELTLERGDVVKVFRKMPDGWYEGERMRDLQWGWFPSNFTVEIADEHTRARNLRERYRLLSKQFNISELNKIINNGEEPDQ